MSVSSIASAGLLAAAVAAGSWADRPQPRPPIVLGGYRVLAVDLHTHSSTWSDGTLPPWGLVLEAERHGLDAIAITGHNQISDSELGRWFSRRVGGPIVLIGEEILNPKYHMIAVGITQGVSFLQPAADAIDDVHRNGGVAIAAHPVRAFWDGWTDDAMRRLDGAEICHPMIYSHETAERELEAFTARASLAAIGSSDYHGLGEMGFCRTYVFARGDSAEAIVEALRLHRTVVYVNGKPYGDPKLIQPAAADGRLPVAEAARLYVRPTAVDHLGRIGGVAGLFGLIVFGYLSRP